MSSSCGTQLEANTTVTAETDPSFLEDYEFTDIVGANNITAKIDSGIGLEELADWCDSNRVPRGIALDLMKRAVESNESFIIY